MTGLGSNVQGNSTVSIRWIRVGTRTEKRDHDSGMALSCRTVQRGKPVVGCRVRIGANGEKGRDDIRMTSAGGSVQ